MKVINKIEDGISIVGVVSLFIIMLIVAVDGLLRHFFNSPIRGAYVLTENYLMVAMIFLFMSYTWRKNKHIAITFVYDKLSITTQNIAYFITLLIGIFIMGLIGITGFDKTFHALSSNHTTSGLVKWPLWLSYIWIPIGSAIFIIRLIAEITLSFILLSRRKFSET